MSTNFSPTPAELALVNQIFAQADPQKIGVLTGEVAVKVFGGAKLPPTTLGEIWNISDEDNKGWLPKKGVAIAVRLIGWAQKGEKVTQALTNKPGPLAVIEGINNVAQQNTGMSLSKSPPPPSFPPLTPQDKAKFQTLFTNQRPTNGLLSGDKARDIFVKSKLSNEQLLKIWNLADTQDRGALDSADFVIGMYFIQGVMSGKISFIPTSLPPGLYQQAGGVSTSGFVSSNITGITSNITGNSGSFSPVSSVFAPQQQSTMMLQPDYTGVSQSFRAPTLPARPVAPVFTNGHASDWDVTASEKAASDRQFDTLDTQKKGFIEGEVAVPFMLQTQLPGEILAQVWDLADINSDGCLTRDGFAVAMHLIRKKLAGHEIPATLPPSLIPPSARAAPNSGSPFSPAHNQTQHQPERDLFSFDDTPPSSAVQPIHPVHTGNMMTAAAPVPFSPGQQRQAVASDPFSSAFHPSPQQDLLSDDDAHTPATSPPLQDRSAEIGNAKNQLQSTNRSLDATKQEREALEQTLANQAAQLSAIQTQLSLAKASYETETKLLGALRERRAAQIAEIDKVRHDLINAESNLSALRAEKAEIEGAFLRDKEEARDLHKRMVEAGQQADSLKTDVEKLKKEAKQQKGLLAIARKQLSTKEVEKAKAEKEHEEAVQEVASITQEKEAVDAEIERLDAAPIPKIASPSPSPSLMLAAAQPLPVTSEVSSPVLSTKSNNPFERLAMAAGSPPASSHSSFLGLSNTIVSSPPTSITDAEPVPPPQEAKQEPVEADPVEEHKSESTPFDDFAASVTKPNQDTELSYLGDDAEAAHVQEISQTPTSANDFFSTPLNSAFSESANPMERFPSLHDITAVVPTEQIPSTDDNVKETKAPEGPAAAPVSEHAHTDLATKLNELDVNESDSSDDTDSDDEPLYKKAVANGKARAIDPVPEEQKAAPAPAPAAIPVAESHTASFDDVFGSSELVHDKSTNGFSTPFDLPSSTVSQQKEQAKPAEAFPAVAGVNEFDATLGKLANPPKTTPADFSFESSFDDTFDFASNSQPVQFNVTPQTPPKTEESQKLDFNSIFGNTTPSFAPPQTTSNTSSQLTNTTGSKMETSFEEAFGGFDSITAPKLDGKPDKISSGAAATEASGMPGSFPSTPTQSVTPAVATPRLSEMRATSPSLGRTRSPPPRTVSPAPRFSSSSKEAPAKEAPVKHSKLSIRLPFGRKKKSEPIPAPPAQHLAPPQERVSRVGTPSSEDDVEPVKQLTAMGFSRTQAVDALEIHGYDVQKALNSLLGAQ